jgi:hypothetical protein
MVSRSNKANRILKGAIWLGADGSRMQRVTRSTAIRVHMPSRVKGALEKMLWTIAVILLVLWALGLVTSYTMS